MVQLVPSDNPQSCEQAGIITYAAINAIAVHPDAEKIGVETFVRQSIDHIRECTVCRAYMDLVLKDDTAKLDPRFKEAFTLQPASSLPE
jgi:hypothetical protein